MRVAQVSGPKGKFEIVERPIPRAGPGTVRIKVAACGVCHSDSLVKEGLWPGLQYPRVPGHEVAGTIDAVGEGVTEWAPGQRVGVGWHGGYCGRCEQCRRGNLFACETQQVTGISFDGGYAEYMIAPVSAVARFPDGLSPADAAPLLCAGVTTFNALRNSGGAPGRCGGGAWRRRTRASGSAVCCEDGLQCRRHRARQGQRAAGPAVRRGASTLTASRRTPRRSCSSWAARALSFRP